MDANSALVNWYIEGSYLKAKANTGDTNVKILYKIDAKINDTWNCKGYYGTITRKVIKLNDTAKTIVGNFYDSVKIEETYSYAGNTQYNYWSKKYGQVLQEGESAFTLKTKNF